MTDTVENQKVRNEVFAFDDVFARKDVVGSVEFDQIGDARLDQVSEEAVGLEVDVVGPEGVLQARAEVVDDLLHRDDVVEVDRVADALAWSVYR